jgi:hypothetical protein
MFRVDCGEWGQIFFSVNTKNRYILTVNIKITIRSRLSRPSQSYFRSRALQGSSKSPLSSDYTFDAILVLSQTWSFP